MLPRCNRSARLPAKEKARGASPRGSTNFVPDCEAARAPGLSSRAIAGASPAGDTSFNVGHDVAAASRAVNAAGLGASPAGQPNSTSRWPISSGGGLQNRRGGCDSCTGLHFVSRGSDVQQPACLPSKQIVPVHCGSRSEQVMSGTRLQGLGSPLRVAAPDSDAKEAFRGIGWFQARSHKPGPGGSIPPPATISRIASSGRRVAAF